MGVLRLRLHNPTVLRVVAKVMAFISIIFSLLTFSAIIFIVVMTLVMINPHFFLGASLSRHVSGMGVDLQFGVTSTGDLKGFTNPQYWNFIYILAVIPYAILYWTLREATRFFRIVGKGSSFDRNESRHIKNIACGGFLYCVTFHGFMSAISRICSMITATNMNFSATPIAMWLNLASLGLGHLSMSWIGLLVLVCVGTLAVVAELMRRASIIAEDYAKIV